MYRSLNQKVGNYGSHYIDENDIKAVIDILNGSHLTCGGAVEKFESSLSTYVGGRYAVSCSNGTTALHLASIAAGIQANDCVIVPAITFVATANAPHYCGAKIIFCDVDPENGIATLENLKASVARSPEKPVAFFPVDLGGQPSTNIDIKNFCKENDIKIIQDACHSLGSSVYKNDEIIPVGSNCYSDFTIFSFHPVKNITTGEGGAVLTNSEEMYQKLKTMRSHGLFRDPQSFLNSHLAFDSNKIPNPWYYEMQDVGFNYRLTDIQAALGISQLTKLAQFKTKRKILREFYEQTLKPYAPIIKSVKIVSETNPCWHLYSILIDFKALNLERSVVMRELQEKGIGTQVHYIPVNLQPYYRAQYPNLSLKGAEDYYAKTLSLPLHVHLNEEDITYITNNLIQILKLK